MAVDKNRNTKVIIIEGGGKGFSSGHNLKEIKNLKGLIECYILAIPFFGNTFLSTLIFAYPSIFIHEKVSNLSNAR